MKNGRSLEIAYFVNSILLFTHEVDSAYWNEWTLFGIPGGIQLFLMIDLTLFFVGLAGFRYVLLRKHAGLWFSLIQAMCGLLAFFLHGVFILKGYTEFTLPMSIILLILILLTSIVQGSLVLYEVTTKKVSAV
jgi:hypothetical protein